MVEQAAESTTQSVERRLSAALSEPLVKAYRVGGFGLAFLVSGAVLLSSAGFTTTGGARYALIAAGLILILSPCYLFYAKEIRPIDRAQKAIERNSEVINNVQVAALSMAQLGLSMQALVFKHANEVNLLLEGTRSQIRALPLPGARALADRPELTNANRLAKAIVDIAEEAQAVLTDVNEALVKGDGKGLKKHLEELDRLRAAIRRLVEADLESSPA